MPRKHGSKKPSKKNRKSGAKRIKTWNGGGGGKGFGGKHKT
jgi:hypothetical protein